MSVFFQFPQYVGIGVSEVFTSVASLEFAYLVAPQSAQSLIMSLRFCSAGVSSFIGSGMIVIFNIQVRSNRCLDSRRRKYISVLHRVIRIHLPVEMLIEMTKSIISTSSFLLVFNLSLSLYFSCVIINIKFFNFHPVDLNRRYQSDQTRSHQDNRTTPMYKSSFPMHH